MKLSFVVIPESKYFKKIHSNVLNVYTNIPLSLLKLEKCMVTLTSQLEQQKKESLIQKLGKLLLLLG